MKVLQLINHCSSERVHFLFTSMYEEITSKTVFAAKLQKFNRANYSPNMQLNKDLSVID